MCCTYLHTSVCMQGHLCDLRISDLYMHTKTHPPSHPPTHGGKEREGRRDTQAGRQTNRAKAKTSTDRWMDCSRPMKGYREWQNFRHAMQPNQQTDFYQQCGTNDSSLRFEGRSHKNTLRPKPIYCSLQTLHWAGGGKRLHPSVLGTLLRDVRAISVGFRELLERESLLWTDQLAAVHDIVTTGLRSEGQVVRVFPQRTQASLHTKCNQMSRW